MKIEKGFRKALARQIREGVEIEMCEGTLLNSKSEWNNSRIPRIIIEEGERQVEDVESGLGNQKEKQQRRKEKITEKMEGQRNNKRGVDSRKEGEQDERANVAKRKKIETEKGEKVETQKRKSKETEKRQNIIRQQRKHKESVIKNRKERVEDKSAGKEYWRKQSLLMVEKNMGREIIIKVAEKHMARIEKGSK